jgi:hypothetical protein
VAPQICCREQQPSVALSVQSRSTAEDQEMLNAAHASAWHWGQVGTE